MLYRSTNKIILIEFLILQFLIITKSEIKFMGRAKHAIPEEVKKLRGRPPKRIKYVYYNRNMDFVKKVDELNLTTGNLAENWKIFWRNFEIFATAIELAKKDEKVQVAIFLNAAGKEAADTFENVIQLTEAERMKYKSVVKSFAEFCK